MCQAQAGQPADKEMSAIFSLTLLFIWARGLLSALGVVGTGGTDPLTGSWVQGRSPVLAISPSSCIAGQVGTRLPKAPLPPAGFTVMAR